MSSLTLCLKWITFGLNKVIFPIAPILYWDELLLNLQGIGTEICFDNETVLISSSFVASNGVVLAAEKKQKSLLYDESTVSKVNFML